MQVLLVEDDEQTAKGIELMLKSLGHRHNWVSRGEAGAALAMRGTYDVILLDVMLPGIDGYEVLQQLRAAKVKTPVILQSGLVERDKAVQGLSLGVADYLIKPYSKAELSARIRLALERAQAEAANGQAPDKGPKTETPEEPREETPREPQEETPEEPREVAPEEPQEVAPKEPHEVALKEPQEETHREPQQGPQPATRVPERRDSARRNVLRSGQIVYQSGNCVMDCVILNLSDKGAALQPEDALRCPDAFTLMIRDGKTHLCEVCWRYRTKLGVGFVD
jgi:DNA-binding response OmpR family regulator